jgi:hypothetical protein
VNDRIGAVHVSAEAVEGGAVFPNSRSSFLYILASSVISRASRLMLARTIGVDFGGAGVLETFRLRRGRGSPWLKKKAGSRIKSGMTMQVRTVLALFA